jgi:DNA-binding beta-propeller fold protein YncE
MKPSIYIAVLIGTFATIPGAAESPLTFVKSIELPRVEGRIDHLAFDAQTQRLFVAALGNNTVEVVDTRAGKLLQSLPGFHEPQGIAVATSAKMVVVANGQGEGVQLLRGDDFRPIGAVRLGDDSDNVRYDAVASRVYVGYGDGAIAMIDAQDAKLLGRIPLAAHPESFQLERSGSRMFVNVPNAKQIAVIDRTAMKVSATWPVSTATANFPMALDEANHRLFIGCRRPAKVLVFDTSNGREVGSFEIVGDTDDLFYDAARKRLYVSGGEGFVDVIAEETPNRFTRIAHVATAAGARTSLFVADQNRFYLAVPHRGTQRAEIREYDVPPAAAAASVVFVCEHGAGRAADWSDVPRRAAGQVEVKFRSKGALRCAQGVLLLPSAFSSS